MRALSPDQSAAKQTTARMIGATLYHAGGTLRQTPPWFPASMSRPRRSLAIEPCLPSPAKEPPAGPGWIHEIKHDGFRILARRDADGVRLFTRNGYDFAARFTGIVAAVESLAVRSCFIDGEAIVVDRDGMPVFDLIRYRQHDRAAVLCAFDLIELEGEDMRQWPIELRKRALAKLLRQKRDGIVLNAHF
jgi:bifunctional non-homologous end joining protein LigD